MYTLEYDHDRESYAAGCYDGIIAYAYENHGITRHESELTWIAQYCSEKAKGEFDDITFDRTYLNDS
jgi:hypothetical protein